LGTSLNGDCGRDICRSSRNVFRLWRFGGLLRIATRLGRIAAGYGLSLDNLVAVKLGVKIGLQVL
jgi:hypothetical protein